MTDDQLEFVLPAQTRLDDCRRLAAFLDAHATTPVNINAAGVERFGGQATQLLLVHATARQNGDAPLRVTAPSEGLFASLATLGLHDALKDAGVLA